MAQVLMVEDAENGRVNVGARTSSGEGAIRVSDPDAYSRLSLLLDKIDVLITLSSPAVAAPGTEVRLDYAGGSDPVYVGTAEDGSATGDAVWTIKKLQYDENGNTVRVREKEGVSWDARAAAF